MKLNQFVFTTVVLIYFLPVQSADNYQVGDTLYVWARSGLNIRMDPNIKARKIGKLAHGSQVIIQSVSDQNFNVKEPYLKDNTDGKDFDEVAKMPEEYTSLILTGRWIKIKSGKKEGYVIDIFLLKYRAPTSKMSFSEFVSGLDSSPLKGKKTVYTNEEDGNEYSYIEFKSKSGIEIVDGDGQFDSGKSIYIPEMTIEEGYVLYSHFEELENAKRIKLEYPPLVLVENTEKALILGHEYFMSMYVCGFSFFIEVIKNRSILTIRDGCDY